MDNSSKRNFPSAFGIIQQKTYQNQDPLSRKWLSQNPPPNLGIKSEISRLWSIPDHQEGIRCKAPRSDD
jgi:hypothetical protein